ARGAARGPRCGGGRQQRAAPPARDEREQQARRGDEGARGPDPHARPPDGGVGRPDRGLERDPARHRNRPRGLPCPGERSTGVAVLAPGRGADRVVARARPRVRGPQAARRADVSGAADPPELSGRVDAAALLALVESALAALDGVTVRSDGLADTPLLALIPPPAIPRLRPSPRAQTTRVNAPG